MAGRKKENEERTERTGQNCREHGKGYNFNSQISVVDYVSCHLFKVLYAIQEKNLLLY
jgi:hypothetical protein